MNRLRHCRPWQASFACDGNAARIGESAVRLAGLLPSTLRIDGLPAGRCFCWTHHDGGAATLWCEARLRALAAEDGFHDQRSRAVRREVSRDEAKPQCQVAASTPTMAGFLDSWAPPDILREVFMPDRKADPLHLVLGRVVKLSSRWLHATQVFCKRWKRHSAERRVRSTSECLMPGSARSPLSE